MLGIDKEASIVLAAYMRITNMSDEERALTAVSSSLFDKVRCTGPKCMAT